MNDIENKQSVLFGFSKQGFVSDATVIPCNRNTDEIYNHFLLTAVEGITREPFRCGIRKGDFTIFRFDVPEQAIKRKGEKLDYDAFMNYVISNEIKPSNFKDLNALIVQYERGNRRLNNVKVNNPIGITAFETDKGFVVFDDSYKTQEVINKQVQYIGDHFFDPNIKGLSYLNIYKTVTNSDSELAKMASSYYQTFNDGENASPKGNLLNLGFEDYLDSKVLSAYDFKPAYRLDLTPDYMNCENFHKNFNIRMSDKNCRISSLLEVANKGINSRRFVICYLAATDSKFRNLLDTLYDLRIRDAHTWDMHNEKTFSAGVFIKNLTDLARKTLSTDYPDLRKPEIKIPSPNQRNGLKL